MPRLVRKVSDRAPVFITVCGMLKTVMLSYDRYRRLEKKAHRRTLLEVFSVPGFERMKTDVALDRFSPSAERGGFQKTKIPTFQK